MPYRLAIPCRKQGCPLLTSDESGYCEQHRKEAQRQQDKDRPSSSERGYNRRWQGASRRFLREHPLCAECASNGKVVAAEVVDHIKAAKGNKELFWNESNWQSLCKECHDRKTASEDGAFGNRVVNLDT